jgi:hypothetical protein
MELRKSKIKMRNGNIEEGINIIEESNIPNKHRNKYSSELIKAYNRGLDKRNDFDDKDFFLFFKLTKELRSSKKESIRIHHSMRPWRAFYCINVGVFQTDYYEPEFVLDISDIYRDSLLSKDWNERKQALRYIHPSSNLTTLSGTDYKMRIIKTSIALENKELIDNISSKLKSEIETFDYDRLLDKYYVKQIEDMNLNQLAEMDENLDKEDIRDIKFLIEKLEL